jgi:hypothetical protein
MTEQFAVKELKARIALLPAISRGAPISEAWSARALAGPWLHADRLIDLWPVADGEDVPLAQAFRFLDIEAVHGAILRALGAKDYPASDPRYWFFPPLEDLLPELRELSWQAMLVGALKVEAIKSVQGKRAKRPRRVPPIELPRVAADWELARLVRDGADAFIEVRVRRATAEPVKEAWRPHPSEGELRGAVEEVARRYQSGARPSFDDEVLPALKAHLRRPDLPRQTGRDAWTKYAPHLKGQRGYRSTKSPS